MTSRIFSSRAFPAWPIRSLLAAGLVVCAVVWTVRQQAAVRPIDLTHSPHNLPLALPRPTADDWPSELGFDGAGRSGLDRLPHQPDYSGQPAWEIPLPGAAAGSPCVWGEVVITPLVEPELGRLSLLAVNRNHGRPLWQTELQVQLTMNAQPFSHVETAACDGQFVFLGCVVQERLVLFAVDLQGRLRWKRDVGPMNAASGRLVSPLLYENLVLISGEHHGSRWDLDSSTSHLTAVHRLTGEIIWRIRRPNHDGAATPVLADVGGRMQLVIPAPGEIAAYSPADGSLLWTCRWPGQRQMNAVAWNDEAVFATTRHPQPTTTAIRADGSGDVAGTHILWQTSAAGSSILSPFRFEDSLLCLQENGSLISLDAASGKVQWQKQLTGTFLAQPLCAGQELCCVDSTGRVLLVDLTQRGKTLAEWKLGTDVIGQPIATRRQLLFRTKSGLISLPVDDADAPLVNTPAGAPKRL